MDLKLSNGYSQPFQGNISKTCVMQDALDYAQAMSRSGKSRKEVRQFYNTLKSIKNDGTNNEFYLGTKFKLFCGYDIGVWHTKYGDIHKIDQFKDYNTSVGKQAFKRVIEFGKEVFGLKKLNNPIPELKKADRLQKQANKAYNEVYPNLLDKIIE